MSDLPDDTQNHREVQQDLQSYHGSMAGAMAEQFPQYNLNEWANGMATAEFWCGLCERVGADVAEVLYNDVDKEKVLRNHYLSNPHAPRRALDIPRCIAAMDADFQEGKKKWFRKAKRITELERRRTERATAEADEAKKAKNARRNAKKRLAKKKKKAQALVEEAEALQAKAEMMKKQGDLHTPAGRKQMLEMTTEVQNKVARSRHLLAGIMRCEDRMAAEQFWAPSDADEYVMVDEPPPITTDDALAEAAERVLQEQVQCDACRDTGTAYYSDGVYGPCLDCDQAAGPLFHDEEGVPHYLSAEDVPLGRDQWLMNSRELAVNFPGTRTQKKNLRKKMKKIRVKVNEF